MYIYIIKENKMKRTQIYLDEEIFQFLEKESRIKHKSMSEIIRESIKNKMKSKKDEIVIKMLAVAGLRKKDKSDPDRYIRNLRRDRKI